MIIIITTIIPAIIIVICCYYCCVREKVNFQDYSGGQQVKQMNIGLIVDDE